MKRNRIMALLCGLTLCASLLIGGCGEGKSSGRGTRPREERDEDDEDEDDEDERDDEDEDEDDRDDHGHGNGGREDGHGNGGHGNSGKDDDHGNGKEDENGDAHGSADAAAAALENYRGIDFTTTDLDGNPVDIKEVFTSNEYTMINIWASWCGPCVNEIPELEEISKDFEEKGCAVVGILLDGDDPYGLSDGKDILRDAGVTYLNLTPPRTLDDIFPTEAVPTSFFIDRSGKIVGEPIVGAWPEGYVQTLDELLGK